MEHPYGAWSLLPPVAAIVLAMVTRRATASLVAGIFVGALITSGGNPLQAAAETLETHLWKTITDEGRMRVFAFTLVMGAMVGVIHRAGGMRGLVDALSRFASNRRRGQLVAWLLGLCVFFDDYANTVLLGNTLRPLTDRLRISREKLAYLVDSTAAPVAGLALVSTWVAGEISFVQEGLSKVDALAEVSPVEVFIASIPYRFYVLLALVFVFLVGALKRDFGPMLRAERERGRREAESARSSESPDEQTAAWYYAVIPVAVCVGAIVWLLYHTGKAAVGGDGEAAAASLMTIFGNAEANFALLWGATAGFVTAGVLSRAAGLLTGTQIRSAAASGAALMLPALGILWAASALSAMTGNDPYPGAPPAAKQEDTAAPASSGGSQEAPEPRLAYRLYTGEYLGDLVGDRIGPAWLPTLVFLLSAVTAFATGTSWGTMGIVMPMVVPLAAATLHGGGEEVTGGSPILLASVGSVLAGAIFGDHCSPISDTTVLSSQASGCDHVAHVWTQMPYALLVAGVAIAFGTLPVGFGLPAWPLLLLGCTVLVACLLLVGRNADEA